MFQGIFTNGVTMTKKKPDVKMTRLEAAEHIDSTYGTLSVWASLNDRHDLKPFKENGKVYYWKSNLDRYLDRELNPTA
jgi:hypothetical protein